MALLVTIVISRLQSQIVTAIELRASLRRAVGEMNAEFKRVVDLGEAFIAHVAKYERSARPPGAPFNVVLEEHRTLTGNKPLPHASNVQVSNTEFTAFLERKRLAENTLCALEGMQATKTLDDLANSLAIIKAHDAQLLSGHPSDRDYLYRLIATTMGVLDAGNALASQNALRLPTAITLVAAALAAFGVIMPLANLTAKAGSDRIFYLSIVSGLLLAIPVVFLVEAWRLRALTTVKIQIQRSLAAG